MKRFDSGVRFYTITSCEIGFPENAVCCAYCPLLETYARKQCRKTGEYISDDRTVGYMCPLQLKENEE